MTHGFMSKNNKRLYTFIFIIISLFSCADTYEQNNSVIVTIENKIFEKEMVFVDYKITNYSSRVLYYNYDYRQDGIVIKNETIIIRTTSDINKHVYYSIDGKKYETSIPIEKPRFIMVFPKQILYGTRIFKGKEYVEAFKNDIDYEKMEIGPFYFFDALPSMLEKKIFTWKEWMEYLEYEKVYSDKKMPSVLYLPLEYKKSKYKWLLTD